MTTPSSARAASDLLTARGYAVVGEAEDAASALAAAARLLPDGVLLDVCIGVDSGIDVAGALTREHPQLAVLLVLADPTRTCAESVRECGARGFVLKSRLVDSDLFAFGR
jgi:DNA-binding NarL/FixJ family response regulator